MPSAVILSGIMMMVLKPGVDMLIVIVLIVIMLNVIILSVLSHYTVIALIVVVLSVF